MKNKIYMILALGIIFGILTSIGYVNPYSRIISLSELVLQLSGSRGEFALGLSMSELVSLIMRMIPYYIFEIYFGISLYRQFCTASIYVFSRYPKRLHWYFKEISVLAICIYIFQIVLLSTVILITVLRYQLIIDNTGTGLLLYHLILYSTWLLATTLSVNLLAIWIGSGASFLTIVGIQIIFITLIGCIGTLQKYLNNEILLKFILRLNPIARLILSWHNSSIINIQVPNTIYAGLNLKYSMAYIVSLFVIILLLGANLVKRHDLLITDAEMGVL